MKLRHTLLILMALPFWLGFAPVLQAQEVDRLHHHRQHPENVRPHRNLKNFKPDPIRAMWLAIVLPGAGQFYNRKYWKLPIIYGGFLGCVYALTWNGQMLSDYSQAYLDIMDSDPNTKSYEKMLPPNYSIVGKEERFKGIFKSKKDTFRRFRDLSIFAFGGVYLLSVIDAYVDAELSTFDISRDLSLQLQPTMIETERSTCITAAQPQAYNASSTSKQNKTR